MKSTTSSILITLVLVLFTVATSPLRPLQKTTKQNSKRQDEQLGVYFCMGANWTGQCQHLIMQPPEETGGPQCQDLGGSPFYGNLDAFGPDQGTECTVFNGDGCAAGVPTMQFVYPGNGDLGSMEPVAWGPDFIGSFQCYPDEPEKDS